MSQYLDKDGASRIAENFLSKQAEQDTILRNLQFDLKEAEHALVKTIQGPAPLNIRALTRPLDDYVISGNTLQDGTPTPEDPVDVVGCGEWDSTKQQYKLPLTVNGTEYPIYLGQVPTTRRIKKLVLTGRENWQISGTWKHENTSVFYFNSFDINNDMNFDALFCMSECFVATTRNGLYNGDTNMIAKTGTLAITIRIYDLIATTTSAFKAWLSAQYANGTPVTVWYVRATPETAVVNEPLHKIGDYADTISMAQSGVEISTTKGFNTITTDTTVLPSNIEVKGVINNA